MRSSNEQLRQNPVHAALLRCRPHFVAAALFSAISNILLLTPSIYMMQVYDRVIPTGGLITLAAISAVGAFALGSMSMFEWLRGRLLVRVGRSLDHDLAGPTLRLVMSRPSLTQLQRAEAMRYLDTLRQGVSSPAATALFDAPWAPVYIVVAFLIHPALGALALASCLLMLALAWHNERQIGSALRETNDAANAAYAKQMQISAHAAEVRALGMATALSTRQLADRARVNDLQTNAAFAGARQGSVLKFIRLALQSGALALGAVLVVEGSVSGGAVFASSLLLSRALQPIEQLVSVWKSILQSRIAYAKLVELFDGEVPRDFTLLPRPLGALQVEHLTIANPVTGRVALADATFAIAAGDIVGLVGLSGSGKSTLLRGIAGAALPSRGQVRIDGASVLDWNPEQLARHVGFLPQNFILFPGTVKDNISRFAGVLDRDAAAIDEAVIAVAQQVGAHDMIQRLPEGYDTLIGSGGVGLSAGQTQRIALARALYGDPCLLLLDEPTAHLDTPSQHDFIKLLAKLRARGTTVLFATHSTDMLAAVSKVLVMKDGRVDGIGPLAEAGSAAHPVSHLRQRSYS